MMNPNYREDDDCLDDYDPREYEGSIFSTRRSNRYNCGGFSSYNGPCGATDCESCYPGGSSESPDEGTEQQSPWRVKIVTARKPRGVGTCSEIKVGDRVQVISYFTYLVGGKRTGYKRIYHLVSPGPAWRN